MQNANASTVRSQARGRHGCGFSEMSHLNHSCLHLSVTDRNLCSDFIRVRGTDRGGMEGLRTGPYMFVRVWVKDSSTYMATSACTRINDRGVKASRTGRLRPPRLMARAAHTYTTSPGEMQQHLTSNSRNVKGKAGDSCLRHGATSSPSAQKTGEADRERRGSKIRHEKNLLTVFRSPTLFFFFSFCSPRLLSMHHNPSVHPSAGHFLRHRA